MEIFAINGPLFFGVADRFQSTLNAMETPPKVFIMYLHNMSAIDMTGIHALEEFLERRRKGCRVLFAAVRKPVHRTLQRVGILRTVGEENVFPSLDEALLRAEEILEDTIMARGKSFATAGFEILKLSRAQQKLKKLQKPHSLVAKAKYYTEKQSKHTPPRNDSAKHEKLRGGAPPR